MNADGVIEAVNGAWTKLLGWQERELVGRSFTWIAHPDEVAASLVLMAGIVETPLTTPHESRLRAKDGHYLWFGWTAAFEGSRIYASGRDITADREHAEALATAEEALRQAQKLEAVGQLTRWSGARLYNLLTVIKSSTDLLKRPSLSEERRARYIGAISDTVDRAAKLTGQLLAFARRQAPARGLRWEPERSQYR